MIYWELVENSTFVIRHVAPAIYLEHRGQTFLKLRRLVFDNQSQPGAFNSELRLPQLIPGVG